jgi:hypothetical protein
MALGIAQMAYALTWSMPNFYDHTVLLVRWVVAVLDRLYYAL